MWQQRLWSKRRKFDKPAKRQLNIALSERGIFEPVKLEKHVVSEIVELLAYNGIPVNIQPERIPICNTCGAFVCKPSKAGQPDLHGWIPAHKLTGAIYAIPFYIECKRPKGGVESYVQQKFIGDAKRDGVLALFARSWKEVKDAFAEVGVTLHDGEIVHKKDAVQDSEPR